MQRVSRLVALAGAACLAAAGVVVAATAPTGALPAGFTVDSAADAAPVAAHCTTPVPGACTLRDAFAAVNGVNANQSITITIGGPISLSQGELLYTGGGGNNALTVNGNGVTVHQATGSARVFNSTSTGLLTLTGMTISGGNLNGASALGAAVQTSGDLTITNSRVTGNTALSTGAAGSDILRPHGSGALSLTNSTVDTNTDSASGTSSALGIVDSGMTTITNSNFTNNTNSQTGTNDADGILDTGTTTVTGSTFRGNQILAAGGDALGVFDTANLSVSNTTVQTNTNSAGGTGDDDGIFDSSTTTVTGSSVTGNTDTATGTGAANGTLDTGTLTVTDSQVSGNITHAAGTGDANGTIDSDPVTLTRSSVTSNTNSSAAGNANGGIDAPTVAATNSTISDNTSTGVTSTGGGIDDGPGSAGRVAARSRPAGKHADRGVSAQAASTTNLVYATVTGNTAQTGANVSSHKPLIAFGSVVALPHGGANCALTSGTTSNGWNFSDDASCAFTNTANGDRQNAGDPRLADLANNGGPGPTRMPLPGSPLIDAVPVASCQADGASGITTDERGIARPEGPGCDIGAVEVEVIVVTPRFTG